jgi:xanthine dehydrogenase iron-sulfur cluster and FAD-binding subunit A
MQLSHLRGQREIGHDHRRVGLGGELDPLQRRLFEIWARSGFCTSGQIMAAKALLLEEPSPTYEQISEWLKGNICLVRLHPAIAEVDSGGRRGIQKSPVSSSYP